MTRCLNCDFDPDDDYDGDLVTATDLSPLVYSAATYRSNADLIASVVRLGYLNQTDRILDPTYGTGKWWKKWEPDNLTSSWYGHEIDFTRMPATWSDFYDAVVYDPPYVSPGGRETTTVPAFFAAYGMTETPKSPKWLQQLINAGLRECVRVTKPRGVILVKCMNYISSGKLWPGAFHTLQHALNLQLELVDWFEMVRQSTPQSQTTQVHARQNHSTLYVLRKP
jgi:hypothetical protein